MMLTAKLVDPTKLNSNPRPAPWVNSKFLISGQKITATPTTPVEAPIRGVLKGILRQIIAPTATLIIEAMGNTIALRPLGKWWAARYKKKIFKASISIPCRAKKVCSRREKYRGFFVVLAKGNKRIAAVPKR